LSSTTSGYVTRSRYSTVEAAQEAVRLVVDAGALAARVAKVDEAHLILILEFSTAEEADRIAREVGGPWMRENIVPLLASDTERSVGKAPRLNAEDGTTRCSQFRDDP
jgi:hypothetical protein